MQGSQWLNELSQQTYAIAFIDLDDQRRELLLRRTRRLGGRRELAFHPDQLPVRGPADGPAYGGNPDGIGWRWLSYVPGFPLPGARARATPELPL